MLPSPSVGPNYGAVSSRAFDKYLKKLNKYCPRHSQGYHSSGQTQTLQATNNNNSINKVQENNAFETSFHDPYDRKEDASTPQTSRDSTQSPHLSFASKSSDVPRIFLDPNFSCSNPETFSQLFPFFSQQSIQEHSTLQNHRSDANQCKDTSQKSQSIVISNANRIDSQRRLVQERLHHYLDSVEEDIAEQVAQKSHHFFQVMTYHDALMTQLTGLIKHVLQLRRRLQHVDKTTFRVVFEICRLKKRREILRTIAGKLELMSSLHKTQPSIQLFLTEKHFSGALDLITTSTDILSDDLRGILSFRHLSSQLGEIQTFIGKMLLGDFKQYITDEIQSQLIQENATIIASKSWQELEKENADQLTSVIYGLLRQNSYTFLEVLQEASFIAVKNLLKEIVSERLTTSNKSGIDTVTGLAKEYAEKASSEDWTKFLDVMLGSLILLLRRIFAIQTVIVKAIASANGDKDISADGVLLEPPDYPSINAIPNEGLNHTPSASQVNENSSKNYAILEETVINTVGNGQVIEIPYEQLKSLKITSQEVLVNVSDQVVERISKILSLRSKEPARKQISTKELHDLSIFADILNEDVIKMTGKISSGFQISLQAQSVIYLESFHESKKSELSDILEKENWKKISLANTGNNSSQIHSQPLVTDRKTQFANVPLLYSLFFTKDTPSTINEITELSNSSKVLSDEILHIQENGEINNANGHKADGMILTKKLEHESKISSNESTEIQSNGLNPAKPINGMNVHTESVKSSDASAESESDSEFAANLNHPESHEKSSVTNSTLLSRNSKNEEQVNYGTGVIYLKEVPFCVSASAHMFLLMICDYCTMCSTLPSIASELGLKTAELVKIYNSKICQLVLGAGAISVSGLKTITIRNMALAKRSLEIIVQVVPVVKKHFENMHHDKIKSKSRLSEIKSGVNNLSLDASFRQFDLAVKHLSNHADELEEKMLTVAEFHLQQQLSKWNPPNQSANNASSVPSANFKALCKQVTKLYESVVDIWCNDAVYKLMLKVHERFIASIKVEVRTRHLLPPVDKINASGRSVNEAAQNAITRRALMSEITFYASWVLQLNVLPQELLEQAKLVEQIFSVSQQEPHL